MRSGPPPFRLRQLQYLVAVAHERSFRKAAARCHVAQSSLSAQVAELEAALGVRAFERDGRGVRVTPGGEELVERARRLLADGEELIDAARRFVDPLKGTLRIGVIPTLAPYLLPRVTPALRAAFPSLTALWVEEKTDALVARVLDGRLDAAVVAAETELGALTVETLGADAFVLAMPLGHRLARAATPMTIEALDGERVLLLDEGHCLRDQVVGLCARAHAEELAFRATSLPTLVQMVASGAGVTFLPQIAVDTERARAAIAVRSFVAPTPGRTVAIAYRARSPIVDGLRAVGAVIAAQLAPSAPAVSARRTRAKGRAAGPT